MSKKKVTLSLDDKVYKDFQKFCEENAIMLSKKIELFMKSLLKNKKATLFFMFFLGLLLINVAGANIIDRGSYWNQINNSDGTYGFEIYSGLINYFNGTGYEPVDLTLDTQNCEVSYDYCVDANLYQAHFKTNVDWGEPIEFIKDGYHITYEPSDMAYGNTNGVEAEYITNLQAVQGNARRNAFNYSNAFTNTDLIYTYTPTQLKEIFILKQLPSPPAQYVIDGGNVTLDYSFIVEYHTNLDMYVNDVNVDGTSFQTSEEIEFRNSSNDIIFFFPKPYAYDSNGSVINVFYQIRVQGPNVFAYIRTNYTWLNESERVFPVYIDPTISINISEGKDSYVREDKVDENYGNQEVLQVDSEENNRQERTLLFFNLSQIPSGSTIINASLELYYSYDDDEDFNVSLYRLTRDWTETGVTWDYYDGTNSWTTAGGDYDSYDYDKVFLGSTLGWKSWNATRLIQEFVDGTYENFGFILIPNESQSGNNYKQLSSKENSNQSRIPRLIVNYDEISPDTTPPYFTNLLDQLLYNNESLSYDIDADDETAFGSFMINWTSIFDIDPFSGLLTNTSSLGIGMYYINVTINDSSNNLNSSVISVEVNQALINYSLSVYPLEYIFAARENKDEINSFEISLYDNFNSSIIVNITYWIEQSDNFSFLSSPVSVELNNSDNITNPTKVNVSIQAESDILDGTYEGNITFEILSLGIREVVNLTYGINPPSGIPLIYSANGEECSNNFPSFGCSYDQAVEQDSSFVASYKVANNGSYNLTSCYIINLLGWSTASISNFSLSIGEHKDFSITYSPTTSQSGVYYDQIHIDCLIGDSFGNRVTSPPNNRPINRIEVKQKASQPPGDDGRRDDGGGTVITQTRGLEITQIPDLIVELGESKGMILEVRNTGTLFLNECKVKGKGENADWISANEIKGLSAGETHDFMFTLTIPKVSGAGEHNVSVGVDCKEYNKSINFVAEILKKDLAVGLIDAEREAGDELKLIYSLSELSGYQQEVEIEIVLFGYNNERAAELKETRILGEAAREEYEVTLTIPESLVGNFNLLINAVSDTGSAFVQEEIILGSPGVGGLAILDDTGTDTIFSIILAAIFVVFVILITRRILKLRKMKKKKTWGWNSKKERFEKARVEKVGERKKKRK